MSLTISNSTINDNQTDGYYYMLDNLLTTYGSTWILDYLNLYVFTIISVLSLLTSLFSLIIFCNMKNSLPLYRYMQVNCISNAVMSLVSVFNFMATSYRLISWSNSRWTSVFFNQVYTPIANLSYFYSSVLDIVILLDRIAIFNRRVKAYLNKYSPTVICIVLFALCLIIDFPYFFVFAPDSFTAKLNANTSLTIWFSNTTPFARSPLGQILSYIIYAIRDVLVMLAQIALGIHSSVLLKKHLNKKRTISTRLTVDTTEQSNQHTGKFSKDSKDRVSKKDTDATIMVIVMCVLSVCLHILMIVMIVYPIFRIDLTYFVLFFVGDIFIPFKSCVDFIMFLKFNKIFRTMCLKYFRSFN